MVLAVPKSPSLFRTALSALRRPTLESVMSDRHRGPTPARQVRRITPRCDLRGVGATPRAGSMADREHASQSAENTNEEHEHEQSPEDSDKDKWRGVTYTSLTRLHY